MRLHPRLSVGGAALAMLLVGACTIDQGAPAALQLRELDFNYFACQVQPMLAARCSMSACHGLAATDAIGSHALRIYSPGKLRLVPQTTLAGRDGQMTLDETNANFASARGLAPTNLPPDDTTLIHKPLAPAAGGGEHKGGVIFRDQTAPGYIVLHQWIAGAKQAASCPQLDQIKAGM